MRALLLVAAIAGCGGQTGTIDLELATSPGSTLLDGIQHLRITLTDPLTVVEADRSSTGFDVVLELDANGGNGSLIVEGFDGGGSLVAAGRSPPFPIAAITARVVVFMATPLSIGSSPSRLPAVRSGVASAQLTYGMVIAGGEDAAGAKTDNLLLYNAYDHSLLGAMAMPAPRALQTLAVASNNTVFLFGGVDAANAPTGTFWRYDSNVPPSGVFSVLAESPELARSGTSAIQVGSDRFVITGSPPLDLVLNSITARTDVSTLSTNGASVVVDGTPIALFAGAPIERLRDTSLDALGISAESTATAAALTDSRIVFAGTGSPATPDLLVVTAESGAGAPVANALTTVRQNAAVAATARFLVVAGGTDLTGAPIASADVLDAVTFAHITTVPCLARSGARAYALPNDQIAIVGGTPANDLIELFTPPP